MTPDLAGLCSHCRHARELSSARASRFWLCGLHERDPHYAKYPRLPVLQCVGHLERDADESAC